MEFTYCIPIQPRASREELEWAWKFTIMLKAAPAFRCAHCNRQKRLDAAHIQSRQQRPNLSLDPNNGVPLCRSCHMKNDHCNGHRLSGRKPGFHWSDAVKRKIGRANRRAKNNPKVKAAMRARALAQWDRQGRKRDTDKLCEYCHRRLYSSIKHRRLALNARFCSTVCHYAFRIGKPRSNY